MSLYTPKKFAVLSGKYAGKVVYESVHHDTGEAKRVSLLSGVDHTSVTFNPAGNLPFFAIPTRSLKEI